MLFFRANNKIMIISKLLNPRKMFLKMSGKNNNREGVGQGGELGDLG